MRQRLENMNEILCGDALTMLKKLPSESVQCCVTSPPYFGLRNYNTETILQLADDDKDCQHEWIHEGRNEDGHKVAQCKLCSAVKYDQQIGLEDTPEAYMARLVEVFREVRRVLRRDGTVWLNLGDSYGTGTKASRTQGSRGIGDNTQSAQDAVPRLGEQAKQLLMIPARTALALQADGWYLRQEIIWHKPNCMPESVTDRCTKSHESIYLLAKSERYYYDATAIREPAKDWGTRDRSHFRNGTTDPLLKQHGLLNGNFAEIGRNKRSVWTVSTQSYSEAHFATFPPKLIEPCILAGTSARACEHCGAPWERVTEQTPMVIRNGPKAGGYGSRTTDDLSGTMIAPAEVRTIGWQPTCAHANEGSGKSIVLDPFMGAGTVALVSIQHHRNYVGIELNPEYVALINKRIEAVQPTLWTA